MKQRQRGFSLLEMIVAVAILGIALSMLYKAAGGATRSIRIGEQYAYAVVIAQSLLADNNMVPSEGVTYEGENHSEEGYRWSVASTAVEFEGAAESVALLHDIVIKVSWGHGERRRHFQLNSVVPVSSSEQETGL